MPFFDVTVTKRLRIPAANFGEAAAVAEAIENGDRARPDNVAVGDVRVTNVAAI